MKIGEMLVQEGLITQDQLNKALEAQKATPGMKIGEVLIDLGFIDVEKFVKVMEIQMKNEGLSK